MKSDKLKKANEYINDNFDKINTRFRQKYHFNVPIGWMNDPNGVCEYKGRIHVFYQFNPYSSKWDVMHWGHAVTDDFIVWQNHYFALAPDQKGVDDGQGCFSGSSVVEDGKICLIYTGVSDKQQVCMAHSDNGEDFIKFDGNPIIPLSSAPEGTYPMGFRDPRVFKKGDYYYMVIGMQDKVSGNVLLYKSENLKSWTFIGKLLPTAEKTTGEKLHIEGVVECPDFFTLNGWDILTGCFMNYEQKGNHFQKLVKELNEK